MMNLASAVAERIQENGTPFLTVGGALDFAELMQAGQLPQRCPAAYVMWAGERASPNEVLGGSMYHSQDVDVSIDVFCIERAGQNQTDGVIDARLYEHREYLKSVLAGWNPDGSDIVGMDYVGGRREHVGAGFVVHKYSFQLQGIGL